MHIAIKEKPVYIKQNVPLAPFTTLGAGGCAEYYAEIFTEKMLEETILWAKHNGIRVSVLAGGSNVLIADEGVKGLVLRPRFSDVSYTEHSEYVEVVSGAGVILDALVEAVVQKNIWGIENLSGIPGTVGATPVQNVGAYGVEVKDVISSVRVYDSETEKFFDIQNDACMFEYRDSIFKKEKGKNFIITHVTFLLQKKQNPKIEYKDLSNYFGSEKNPTLRAIRNAVLEIRSKKFPDWHVVGTAGSFFKNPVVSKDVYIVLQQKYPDIPAFNTENGDVKISLGWVLEHVCALKGYTEGNVRLFEKQALVLVCTRGTSATEIKNFSEKIIARVDEKINIQVEREVTLMK